MEGTLRTNFVRISAPRPYGAVRSDDGERAARVRLRRRPRSLRIIALIGRWSMEPKGQAFESSRARHIRSADPNLEPRNRRRTKRCPEAFGPSDRTSWFRIGVGRPGEPTSGSGSQVGGALARHPVAALPDPSQSGWLLSRSRRTPRHVAGATGRPARVDLDVAGSDGCPLAAERRHARLSAKRPFREKERSPSTERDSVASRRAGRCAKRRYMRPVDSAISTMGASCT